MMQRKPSSSSSNFRRPRRSEPNKSPRNHDETDDQAFMDQLKETFTEFQGSNEQAHHLAPMNSYQRRLVHQLSTEYGFTSESEGEESERHIVLTKSGVKKAAPSAARKKATTEGSNEERIPAQSRSRSRQVKIEEPLVENDQETEEAIVPKEHAPRSAQTSQTYDYGDREFLVPISPEGIEVMLDDTGFVGLKSAGSTAQVLDKKLIKLGSFKVKQGKLVTVDEASW